MCCFCASIFAPEGQFRLQLASFLRTSRRDWVLVHVSRPWSTKHFSGLFLPQQGIVSMFFSGAGRQPISASPVLFLANVVCFSVPANVHPASYLDFIYSWLSKVDPTEIYCSYLYARSNFDEYANMQDILCSSAPRFTVYLILCASNNLWGEPVAIPDAYPEVP